MKKLIFVLFLPLTLIFAQSNEEEKPIDLTGKFALMFQIDQNFDLNSFQGMSFAGKYFFSDDWGVRLVFETYYGESDENSSYHQHRSGYYQNDRDDRDIVSYKVIPSIMYKFQNNNNFKFYIGAGPFVAYSNNEYAEVMNRSEGETNKINERYKNYAIGFTFFTNVEWFVSDNISLSAEYGFEYSYLETEAWNGYFSDDVLMEERTTNNTKKLFQDLPISLGVSIYF
ncbi:hypothetical protein ASZ90_004168 [hydrocarbon metagenome]|uniref:Outer membrane protein beta-barrel domain-containing protein n=1 Tax=hydrocarbon metagenome TaxID=938273 RepID=A0A0W8FZ29_9ZZZZ